MSRKKERLRVLAQNAAATKNRSAYVWSLRETVWCERQPEEQFARQVTHASKVMLTHPDLRVVRFPSTQAAVFLGWGDDLVAAGSQARPPFAHVFYDFGFTKVGEHELVGSSIFGDEMSWSAISYIRHVPTNNSSSIFCTSESALMKPGSETIGPVYDPAAVPTRDVSDAALMIVSGALAFLESANVDLIDATPIPKGHQAFGIPHHEVIVRQSKKRLVYPEGHESEAQQWSHRWEVRGHFKHFRRGATFEKNADRRVITNDGDEFVRIWCPPHVKGPDDKPLVPKLRKVVA